VVLAVVTGDGVCHRGRVLGALRDDSGKPNVAVRGLALLVALLLGFPLTLWLLSVVRGAADLAW
jgi:hypothetical protein